MNLNFNNVEVLGISQEIEKFDSSFNFNKIKTVSVSGLFLDLQNTEGVKDITEASELFIKSTKTNRGTVLINGVSYGDGFVSSFDLDGDQISTANYSAEIIIRESGSLSDIIIKQNEGGDYDLSTNSKNIVEEDLKFLTSFSEEFDFSVSEEKKVSFSHDVECLFGYRESIITNDNTSWVRSLVGGRSTNLGNRGKGSIRVNQGRDAYLSVGQLQSGTTYVVEFEYLGQYANESSWTDVSLYAIPTNINNKNNNIAVKTINSRGIHKLEFTPDTTGNVYLLLETSTNAASFDNVRLYKKDEMPLEKSKALSELLFDSSPYYAVLESNIGERESGINLFDNFVIDQSFDEINLEFSASKSIDYVEVKSGNQRKYSTQTRTSKSFQENGIVLISENIEIKAMKDKTESALREYIDFEKALVRNRIQQSFSNYESFIDYGCHSPTNTKTPVSFSDFSLNPLTESENIDINSGTASLVLTYSNDPNLENVNYFNESSVNISESEGNNFIEVSGTVRGIGDSNEDRFNNARTKTLNFDSEVNKAKQNNSISGTFNLYSKSIQSNKKEGTVQYNFKYSDGESLEYSDSGIVKSYDIEVSTVESGLLYNEFSLGCQQVAQIFRDLRTPEQLTVKISLEGYLDTTPKQLFDEAKNILSIKSLLLGEDSKRDKNQNFDDVNDFLIGEKFSFSEENKTLNYSRTSLSIECPPTPTRSLPANYGGGIVYQVPTPTEVPAYVNYDGDYFIAITLTPETGTPFVFPTPTPIQYITTSFTPIQTSSSNPQPTPTPQTAIPTPTPQQTPTITLTAPETRLVRRLIPENWNKTIAELLPGQQVSYGVTCLDNNSEALTMTTSYAENTLVRDCIRAGNPDHQSFSEIYFTVPIDYPEPEPLVADDGCTFEYVDLPAFWGTQYGGQEYDESLRNAWADLDPITYEFIPNTNVQLIGYELPGGQFSYVQSGDLDLPIILSSEYNNYHPNYFKEDSLIITGRLYFKNCNQSVYQPYYSITEVDVPTNYNNTIQSLAPTNGFWTYFGVESCSLDIEHYYGEDENGNPTERLDINQNTLVDGCDADLSSLTQINKVFFQQLP